MPGGFEGGLYLYYLIEPRRVGRRGRRPLHDALRFSSQIETMCFDLERHSDARVRVSFAALNGLTLERVGLTSASRLAG